MVNASNQPTSPSSLPVTPMTQTATNEPMTAFYVKDNSQTNMSSSDSQHKRSRSKAPLFGGLILVLLIIAGLVVGLLYLNQQQDTRKQADDTGTGNCSVCDLNNDGVISANEVSQLSQCIGAQIGENDGGFCFENGQVRDPNGDGVLNSADTLACTECIGGANRVTPASLPPTAVPTATPASRAPDSISQEDLQAEGENSGCTTAMITNASAEWTSNYSKIKLTWTTTGGQFADYEIWNIGYGTLEQLGQSGYYLSKLTSTPLAGTTLEYLVESPNSLPTRRFLVRGVQTRNNAGTPSCYKQSAVCQPPHADNRQVTKINDTTYRLSWQPTQKPHQKYEIWLIGNGTLEELGPERYYLAKLLDNIDVNASSAEVSIPEQYRAQTTHRFLLRSINYSESNGTVPRCYNQWALAVGVATTPTPSVRPSNTPTPTSPVSQANRCTISFTIGASSTPTPTNTPNPTATPTPSIGCNQVCTTNADCSNSNHICFTDSSGVNRCRLESNPTNSSCQSPTTQTVTQAPVQLPEELPQSGPSEWLTWMKAGLAVLGIGAALLLML